MTRKREVVDPFAPRLTYVISSWDQRTNEMLITIYPSSGDDGVHDPVGVTTIEAPYFTLYTDEMRLFYVKTKVKLEHVESMNTGFSRFWSESQRPGGRIFWHRLTKAKR